MDDTVLSLDAAATTRREFVLLWWLATTAYGVGDVVTTVALFQFHPGVTEGNPVVAVAMTGFGIWGLVLAKLLAFAGGFGLSLYAVHVWRDRFLYYLPPLAFTLVGVFFTVYNVRLMLGA